jgi:hypothetical protein
MEFRSEKYIRSGFVWKFINKNNEKILKAWNFDISTKKEIYMYDFYIDSGRKKTQSYFATYFSEKFGTQIQRQVITRM